MAFRNFHDDVFKGHSLRGSIGLQGVSGPIVFLFFVSSCAVQTRGTRRPTAPQVTCPSVQGMDRSRSSSRPASPGMANSEEVLRPPPQKGVRLVSLSVNGLASSLSQGFRSVLLRTRLCLLSSPVQNPGASVLVLTRVATGVPVAVPAETALLNYHQSLQVANGRSVSWVARHFVSQW